MLKKIAFLLGASVVAVQAAPAYAGETLSVPFTSTSVATANQYSGNVSVTVSGTGYSDASRINDAFYFTDDQSTNADGYYQLGFGTSPLDSYEPSAAIVNTLGYRPAYSDTNTYSFSLNVGSALTTLYFNVTDQDYSDNGGAFTIKLNGAGVPEPATWAMMLLGFGMVGAGLRYRRKSTAVRFA